MMYLLLSVLVALVAISMVHTVLSDPLNQPIGDFAIPSWIKNTAGWWADGQIDDSSFVSGIQWLILNDVITIPSTQQGAGDGDNIIPSWVKNTAGWWAEDKIHDITFVAAIRYLINEGIMIVVQVSEPEPAKCTFKGLQVTCPAVKEVEEITDFYMEVNGSNCCLNWAYVGNDYRFQIETFDKKHGNQIDGVTITAKIISKGGELRHDFGQVTTEDGIYNNSITIPSMDWYAENILSVTGTYNGVEKTIEKEFEVFVKKSDRGGAFQITSIVAKDAETDGTNSFTELAGAHGVSTFVIGSSTYAIVTSQTDSGVQIIDISDPENIVAKDAETDSVNGFTMLSNALDVDTFTIGSSTYAIVVAYTDDGVQMIDISDPANIVAKDAETDGSTFTELDGARDVETFVIGSSTYAIVVSWVDDGVQIIDISDPTAIVAKDTATDEVNGFTNLNAANGVSVFTISGSTYAIVASVNDSGVQIIDISDPTDIVAKDAEDDSTGFPELSRASSVDTFTIGSSTYAIVVSGGATGDDGVQIIDISDPANIVAKDSATDGVNGFTMLDGPEDVDTFTCGDRTYAIVAGITDNGVQIIDISDPANIVAIDAETDGVNGFTMLGNPYNVEAFKISNKPYAMVASYGDNAVQMIEMPCGNS